MWRSPVVALLLCVPGSVWAEGNLRVAAEEFDAGSRAYRSARTSAQFQDAAQHFESAYAEAPNAEALRSAIVARQKGKQLARAATLAALGQSAHGDDPGLAQASREVLAAAAKSLGRGNVQCTPKCSVAVDGQLASLSDAETVVVFLEPGTHTITAQWQGEAQGKTREIQAVAGASEELKLSKPEPAPKPPPEPAPVAPVVVAPPTKPVVEPAPVSRKPLGKGLFFVMGGLTVAAGAATVVSGVATMNSPGKDAVRRDCAGLDTSCATYQQGKDAELRTNVLLGASIGLAVLTVGVALFTDFSGAPPARAAADKPATGLRLHAPRVAVDPRQRSAALGIGGQF